MNIAVLSDIHGNYTALQTCMEYIFEKDIERFIFLGDYAGEFAYPQKTMEFLYTIQKEYQCYFIRGNKEDYWINYYKNGEQGWKDNDSTTGCLLYSYNSLTERDINFFSSLPHKLDVAIDGMPPITICHGSPNKTNEKMLPDNENTFSIMENGKNPLTLCGHTHVQLEIKHNGRQVLNAGSVGLPLFGPHKAQFMILHGNAGCWEHEFINLAYDIEKVISDLHESGLDKKAPCWCKVTEDCLRNGNTSHGVVLAKAIELCAQDTGECNWPEIPEKYWEQAVEILVNCASC